MFGSCRDDNRLFMYISIHKNEEDKAKQLQIIKAQALVNLSAIKETPNDPQHRKKKIFELISSR